MLFETDHPVQVDSSAVPVFARVDTSVIPVHNHESEGSGSFHQESGGFAPDCKEAIVDYAQPFVLTLEHFRRLLRAGTG